MKRYVTLSKKQKVQSVKSDDDDEPSMLVGTEVYPQEQEPFFIGLYDSTGQPLYAIQDRVRIGFCSQYLDQD